MRGVKQRYVEPGQQLVSPLSMPLSNDLFTDEFTGHKDREIAGANEISPRIYIVDTRYKLA
jgi:hypothetical protein